MSMWIFGQTNLDTLTREFFLHIILTKNVVLYVVAVKDPHPVVIEPWHTDVSASTEQEYTVAFCRF